jgi:hypothetical protein
MTSPDLQSTLDAALVRLAAAERVCVLVGWTAQTSNSDLAKALSQAWQEWHRDYGSEAEEPTDEEVLELAARRVVIRDVTLIRLRREFGDGS